MATSARNWKKNSAEELQLPSGNTCLIKRPGMEKLFSAGVLPDELTKIALENVESANSGGKPQDHKSAADAIDPEIMKKFMESENAIVDIFSAFDKVTAMCVVEPRVLWHMRDKVDDQGRRMSGEGGRPLYEEIPFGERDEDVLYTDDIDQDDKVFIFNFVVGGTRDLERFRAEYGDALATVQSGENMEMSSVGVAGD